MSKHDPSRGYIPEPLLVLMGCTAWVNHFDGPCPVCKGLIGQPRSRHPGAPAEVDPLDYRTFCARCGATHPAVQAKIDAQLRKERLEVEDEEIRRQMEQDQRRRLQSGVALTEKEKREIWLGNADVNMTHQKRRVHNLAAEGRKWLREIGAEPDWNLIINKRGRVIGRYEEPQEDPSEACGLVLDDEPAPAPEPEQTDLPPLAEAG